MISPARSGIRRLTRLGIKTFISAMAPPATTVPGYSSTGGLSARSSRPAASSVSAAPSTRSSPNLRLSGAPVPENTPKHSTGMAASSESPAGEMCRAVASSGNSGGKLVIAARRVDREDDDPGHQQYGAAAARKPPLAGRRLRHLNLVVAAHCRPFSPPQART